MVAKIAIQGIAGSFHDEAAHALVGNDIELVACETFSSVFSAVKNNVADCGLVAIENCIHGSINAVYRLLQRENLWIQGEIYLHIQQYLIGSSSYTLTTLNTKETEVISHPAALAQCELWLDQHLTKIRREEVFDTAGAVKQIMEQNSENIIAIAGKTAAKLYKAKIIAGPINDDPNNYTRFVLLSKDQTIPSGANKTSIILRTGHSAGALYRALGVFAQLKINLSKLDSHPLPGDTWHYAFYIDFDACLQDPIVQTVVGELEKQDCSVQILGSYVAGIL